PAIYNSGAATQTTLGPLVPSQVVVAGDYAVEVIDALRAGSTTARTLTAQTGWTLRGNTTRTGTTPASYAMRSAIAYRSSAGTFTSAHTLNGTALDSMSGMTIKQLPIPNVTNGATVPNIDVYANDKDKVVDAFTVTGGGTLTGVTITGNVNTTPTNVSQVHIYRKGNASTTVYTPGVDTLIGQVTNPTFPLTIPVSENIVSGTNYIVTYDINPAAIGNGTSITLTGRVTAITPTGGTVTDTAGATLTVLVTTSILDATEPPAARVKNSSVPTLLDAFSVRHTGVSPTDDDTVTNVTVTMTPQYISGGSAATLSKIKLVEIVDATNTIVYGSMNAATSGDSWNIPLNPGFPITSSPVTYYVRIRTADSIIPSINDPSGTSTGYYGLKGTITGFQHTKSNNRPVLADADSQTIAIDFEAPNNVPAFATVPPQVTDTDGDLNVTWSAVKELHSASLHATTRYRIMRRAPSGGYPNPYCIDGTDMSAAGGTMNYGAGTATDHGLVSTQATQYKYRICTVDSLGNISKGITASGTAKVHSVCGNMPIVKLVPDSQIVKTPGTVYGLQIANMDTGVCPDINFALAIIDESGSNPAHFTKSFPATVTLGTGGAGHASTGKSTPIIIGSVGEAAGAIQLETYRFRMTVTAPGYNGGLPIYTGYVDGLLNDMPPIVHNSANMGKFSYGSWGQTYTCATCHSNSTTNIKGVYQIISTPIGRRNVVFTKTSSGATDYVGVYSNDQRLPNKNVSTGVCSVCHHKTRQHQYSASKPLAGSANNEAYVSNHNNSRDCVKCHTHNSAFRSITGTCGECHGTVASGYAPVDKDTMVKDVTNALGPLPSNYGAHKRHSNANVGCGACHSNSNHGLETSAWMGDGKLQMGFQIDNTTFTGFNPNQSASGGSFWGTTNLNFPPFTWNNELAPGTIINSTSDYNNSCVTYCHGNWTGNADQGSQQQPIWIGDGNEIVCGSCHYATGTTPPQGGSHLKHASTTGAGLGIACTKCHANAFNSFTGASHINGKVEWDLSNLQGA